MSIEPLLMPDFLNTNWDPLIAIVVLPIALPIMGIIYIGTKIYDKFHENKVASLRQKIMTTNYLHEYWDDKHIVLGYSIQNTDIIIVATNSPYYAFLNQIEKRWVESRNFIIVQVDVDDMDLNTLETLNEYICPYESNTIKILDKSKQGPTIHNVENSIIQLTNYYGIVYNKFKCEYYT